LLQTVTQGSLAVVFPRKIHSYQSPNPSEAILLIVAMGFLGALQASYQENQPVQPILAPEDIPDYLVEHLKELTHKPKGRIAQALVYLIFARLWEQLPVEPRTHGSSDALLFNAISMISETYKEDISLRIIATRLGVSECHLSHMINRGIGMPLREYINTLRILDAQHLLSTTNLRILEIAMESGFQNLRTFNRAFLEITRCTPKEYRKTFLPQSYRHAEAWAEGIGTNKSKGVV
ncbi:MAG: AraC family transcriptional regulator, partial [Angelakisella sp.]